MMARAAVPGPDAVMLGNGPSLAGFDFGLLAGRPTFGMNAAYRHWDAIGWYPTHYACLDEVVGLSHAPGIASLIERAEEIGIGKFLLRANLIEALGASGKGPRVVDFDALRERDARFARDPLTTGSHATIWAASLGHARLLLLGIDANYVEVVEGAEARSPNVLEIVRNKPNPNYFFDGYQREGDRYHVPNIGGQSHLESWRVAAEILAEMDAAAYNGSPVSKVDAFEFCDAVVALRDGEIRPVGVYETFMRREPPLSRTVV